MSKKLYMFYVGWEPSANWSDKQMSAALNIASEVIDIKYPKVDEGADIEQVYENVDKMIENIKEKYDFNKDNSCFYIAGWDSTVNYAIVERLKQRSIKCYSATFEVGKYYDSRHNRNNVFEFVRFRSYTL